MTTMAFCPECAPVVADRLDDVRERLLGGWRESLRTTLCLPEYVADREFERYRRLVQTFQIDEEYGVRTFADVDRDEGVL